MLSNSFDENSDNNSRRSFIEDLFRDDDVEESD
jgi:hypothetical protein